ncbi:MAG: hypothetical protein JNN07_08450 [Verrucomicrobiales bacterium]|nr:hypothetical protein [Verrucomicrobiales bacterium]
MAASALALFTAVLSLTGADRPPPSSVPVTLPHAAVTGDPSETIAHRILRLEAEPRRVEPSLVEILNRFLEEACAAAGQVKRARTGRWDPHYAEAVLRSIDATLIRQGFVYPETGATDFMADSLTPSWMTAARRSAFQMQSQNHRRLKMIAERFPGPFYAADCDTVSFLYLSVAQRLQLPLVLVVIPSRDRRPGHAFVRWREGNRQLNWETMDGAIRTDESYVKPWNISSGAIQAKAALADLTVDQAMGCVHYWLAVRHQRQGDSERALQELAVALELHPENLDARREFAWVTATGARLSVRDHAAALRHITRVLEVMEDPDARDTLAAVYASAGQFDLAVREQRKAIRDSSTGARAGYRRRLELYEQGKVYRKTDPRPPQKTKSN